MKQEIKKLIAKGETEKALKNLMSFTNKSEFKKLHEEIVLQSAKFQQYKVKIRKGVISFEEAKLVNAEITNALLEILDDINDNEILSLQTAPKKLGQSSFFKRYKLSYILFFIFLTSLFFILWTDSNSEKSFSLTVLVHGKKGKDDLVLRNQGEVILDIGTARLSTSINEKGEATFKEIPIIFNQKNAYISINHPQPYLPVKNDKEILLTKNQAIYLEIELKGIDKIFGRVLDFKSETPLDSVMINVQGETSYSNQFGWFELDIPSKKQKKFISVAFYKKGYKLMKLDSIAPHTHEEIEIYLKR